MKGIGDGVSYGMRWDGRWDGSRDGMVVGIGDVMRHRIGWDWIRD